MLQFTTLAQIKNQNGKRAIVIWLQMKATTTTTTTSNQNRNNKELHSMSVTHSYPQPTINSNRRNLQRARVAAAVVVVNKISHLESYFLLEMPTLFVLARSITRSSFASNSQAYNTYIPPVAHTAYRWDVDIIFNNKIYFLKKTYTSIGISY